MKSGNRVSLALAISLAVLSIVFLVAAVIGANQLHEIREKADGGYAAVEFVRENFPIEAPPVMEACTSVDELKQHSISWQEGFLKMLLAFDFFLYQEDSEVCVIPPSDWYPIDGPRAVIHPKNRS